MADNPIQIKIKVGFDTEPLGNKSNSIDGKSSSMCGSFNTTPSIKRDSVENLKAINNVYKNEQELVTDEKSINFDPKINSANVEWGVGSKFFL